MMLKTLAVSALAVAAMAVPAQAACSTPTSPSCLNSSGEFTTDAEAQGCYDEFQVYYQAMLALDTCLNEEITAFVRQQQTVSDSAWNIYEQALAAYNRRAGI